MYCQTILPVLPHHHTDAQQAAIPCLTHRIAISLVTLIAQCLLHVNKPVNYYQPNCMSRLLLHVITRLYQQIRRCNSYACYIYDMRGNALLVAYFEFSFVAS